MEGRGETWRKTQKERGSCVATQRPPNGLLPRGPKHPSLHAPLGIMAFGHQCTLPRLRRPCSPSRTYASGPSPVPGVLAISTPSLLSEDPGVCARTAAPSPAGGSSLGAGLRAPPSGAAATAALPSDSAPPGARPEMGGQGRERALAAGPSLISIPSSSAGPVRALVRMRGPARGGCSGGDGMEGGGGCARQASW